MMRHVTAPAPADARQRAGIRPLAGVTTDLARLTAQVRQMAKQVSTSLAWPI